MRSSIVSVIAVLVVLAREGSLVQGVPAEAPSDPRLNIYFGPALICKPFDADTAPTE